MSGERSFSLEGVVGLQEKDGENRVTIRILPPDGLPPVYRRNRAVRTALGEMKQHPGQSTVILADRGRVRRVVQLNVGGDFSRNLSTNEPGGGV